MPTLHIQGKENLTAPALYMPNRMSLTAVQALNRLLDGKLCFLSDPTFPPSADITRYLRRENIPIIPLHFRNTTSLAVREQILDQFDQGRSVVFLPGTVARTRGTISDVPSPFLSTVGSLHLAPVPLFLGYYGNTMHNCFSNTEEKATREALCILPQLKPGPQTGERVLQTWLNTSAELFAAQPWIQGSLTTELVRAIRQHPDTEIIDGLTGSTLSFYKALGVSMAAARHLRRELSGQPRAGIILPPGPGAVIATIACLLSGITPVMINYATSHHAFESTVRQAGLSRFITARKFAEKLPAFPWPPQEQLLFIEELLKKLSKPSLITHILLAKTAPASLICRLFGTDKHRGDAEAIILFTSGSSGDPKGVVITHRMMLANLAQCASRLDVRQARFHACLPIFHSFGLTVTMFLPLLAGSPFCTHPNPTDARALCEQIAKYKLTLICATPTFARAMMRRAHPDSFRSVDTFIVGAEKLQPELAQEFRERFGVELLEGYGLTEACPVCAVNLPDAAPVPGSAFFVPGTVPGSVGAPLPGIAVRVTDPDDDTREVPLTEQGMLWLKGANLFSGYIGLPDVNRRVLRDGWFKTGDIGRLDLNGFIFLGGRLSRFSKIGGEMVPHDAVELALTRILNLSPDGGVQIAITGTADAQKGEAIVLLSALPEHQRNSEEKRILTDIRAQLQALNMPNLWAPKYIVPVEAIPVLPTGKLDIRGCQLLTQEALGH